MRQLLTPLFLIILIQWGNAQSIPIVDDNFRYCLFENAPHLFDRNYQLIVDSARSYQNDITCTNRGIHEVPELIYFDSVRTITLNQNELERLPSFDHFKQLRYLYVAENNLTVLPRLDSVSQLEQLIAWKNQLKTLPDLSMLDQLHRLDVPVNQLTEFPNLSTNAPLKTLLVDDNLIDSLPDLSRYNLLEIVKVVNNQMSFDDLEKIHSQPNPEIYDFYPQKPLNVLSAIEVEEGKYIAISAPVDQSNSSVSFSWFSDDDTLPVSFSQDLIFDPIQIEDEGFYYVSIVSSLFPDKPLYTNKFQVKVHVCPDLEQVVIVPKSASCISKGSITIDSEYEYTIRNDQGLAVNDYTQLIYGTYTVAFTNEEGCTKTYPEAISIYNEPCKEVLLTLDDNGYQDEYYFDEKGDGILFDKFGNEVMHMTLPMLWKGMLPSDKKIEPGYYTLSVNNGEKYIGITILH